MHVRVVVCSFNGPEKNCFFDVLVAVAVVEVLRSLNSNYKHNFCLFSTASISYTFDKFCSTELSFKDHALGGTSYNGQYGEAPPETGIFFSLQVYERVGILLVEVYKRVGKSVSWVCERAQKG